MTDRQCDCLVVGAGLAGLQCARLLAGHGLSVLLVDRKRSVDEAVHTTGIFVRRAFEDFALPPACLGPAIRHVTLYSPARRAMEIESDQQEFRVGRMGELYQRLLKDARAAGAGWLGEAHYLASEPVPTGRKVQLRVGPNEETIHARFLIAADGANSRVARDLGLSINSQFLVGVEHVFDPAPIRGVPRLHLFLNRQLAPGYIGWLAADGESAHLGVAGQPGRFQPLAALEALEQSLGHVVDLAGLKMTEQRSGRIPVGGILPRLASHAGMLVGDAAGAVSPLTAGGFTPCLRLSQLAASAAAQYLNAGDAAALAAYDGNRLGREYRSRRMLRGAFGLLRSNWLLELGCAALRTPPGKRFAKRVIFSRANGPWPDLPSALERREPALALAKKRTHGF